MGARARQKRVRNAKKRPRLLLLLVIIVGVIWGGQYIIRPLFFAPEAAALSQGDTKVDAQRSGRHLIFDRNYNELAVTFTFHDLYAMPLEIVDPEATAREIAQILQEDAFQVQSKLTEKRNVVWLAQGLDAEVAREIEAMNLPGVRLQKSEQRYYPYHFLAAHIIGFVHDDAGFAGVENYYENILSTSLLKSVQKRKKVETQEFTDVFSERGDLVLTLDMRIQQLLEQRLKELQKEMAASTASAVVLEAETGGVLAFANLPSFNPNRFADFDNFERRNRGLEDPVHAGLLEKIVKQGLISDKQMSAVDAGKRGEYWWQEEEGVYYSKDLLDSRGPSKTLQRQQFQKLIEMSSVLAGKIDLPHSKKVALNTGNDENPENLDTPLPRVTLMDMASAFHALVSEGNFKQPHVAESPWSYLIHGPEVKSEDKEEDRLVWAVRVHKNIRNSAEAAKEEIFLAESLVARHKLFVEKELQQEKAELSNPKEQEQTVHGYQQLLLGAVPADQPKVVIAIVVDADGKIPLKDSRLRSMCRSIGENIVDWSREMANPPGVENVNANLEALYAEWLEKGEMSPEEKKVVVENFRPDEEANEQIEQKMPDLIGYSLRKALVELQKFDMDVRIDGTGWVTEQEPPSGSDLSGQNCLLRLGRVRNDLMRTIIVQ